MRRKASYRSYQGRRSGSILLAVGLAVVLLSAVAYLCSPFSIRKFAAFPALGGIFLVLFGASTRFTARTGKRMRLALWLLLVLGVLSFGLLEGIIVAGARDDIDAEPDVMVVLGAQVKPWGPSVLLVDRLDTALEYLREHPELPVVVTGGQGPDEPFTEAVAMRDYLVAHGLEEDRIWLEEAAHNTTQNLEYTRALLEEKGYDMEDTHLLVVSNGFHLARVRMLAGRHELDISTLAAPESHAPSRVQSYIREAPALVKSWLLDR